MLFGTLIGAVALWAALREVTTEAVVSSLLGLRPGPALLALATSLAAVFVLARRWQLLFAPDYAGVSFWLLFRSLVIGQMLNIASPVRVGEMSRLYFVQAEGIPSARVLATLAVEKACEVVIFGLAAVSIAGWITVPADGTGATLLRMLIPVAGVVLLWAVGPRVRAVMQGGRVSGRVPAALRRKVTAFYEAFADGMKQSIASRLFVQVALLTVAALALPAIANQFLLRAFDIQAPFWTGLALLVVLQIGSVPPSLPGRLGVFNYLTVVTLESVGVDRVSAASYSIALYVIAYVPKLLLGGLLFAMPYRHPRGVPVS